MRVRRTRQVAALIAAILAGCSAAPSGGASHSLAPASASAARTMPPSLPAELQGVAWWRTQHPGVQDVGDVGNLAVGTLSTGVTATIAGEPGPGGWQPIFTDAAAGSIAYGTTTRGRGEVHLVEARSGADRLLATFPARPVAGVLSADGRAVLTVLVDSTGHGAVWRVPTSGQPQLLAPVAGGSASSVPLDASRVSMVSDRSAIDSAVAVLTCDTSCTLALVRLRPDGTLQGQPGVPRQTGLKTGDRLLGLRADWLLTTRGLWSWTADRFVEPNTRGSSTQLILDGQGAPLLLTSSGQAVTVRPSGQSKTVATIPSVSLLDPRLLGAGADLPASWFLGVELGPREGQRSAVAVHVPGGTVIPLEALGAY